MFGSNDKRKAKRKTVKIQTLIGQHTEIHGDVRFEGGLHIDGTIKGNVYAIEGSNSMLTLSEHGTVEGEVRVHNVVLNGTVIGDVYAGERIELDSRARVTGNVYYNLIEMAMGAEVNGKLVHRGDEADAPAPRLEATPAKAKAPKQTFVLASDEPAENS